LIFYGEDKGKFKKGEVVFVDHVEKTITKLCGNGSRRRLKTEQVLQTKLTTMRFHLQFAADKKKSFFGKEKSETINGMQCPVYDVRPFWAELTTREPSTIPPKPKLRKAVICFRLC
jgi:hypothetical protein